MESWFICDGRFRVHAINAIGHWSGRIIEIENLESGKRVHAPRRLERLVQALRRSDGDLADAAGMLQIL